MHECCGTGLSLRVLEALVQGESPFGDGIDGGLFVGDECFERCRACAAEVWCCAGGGYSVGDSAIHDCSDNARVFLSGARDWQGL